jgi:hypothetical protein
VEMAAVVAPPPSAVIDPTKNTTGNDWGGMRVRVRVKLGKRVRVGLGLGLG